MFVDLAGKWAPLLLLSLHQRGEQRFSELQRSVGGISRKMLVQTLRTLQRDGLLDRTVRQEATPPQVIYGPTALGSEAARDAGVLCAWTERRAEQVYRARAHFDARMPGPSA
ncbi:winged helix-turn-helix transcriptional regulator [Streptomyces sp. S1D4-11]|nr:helix-turn-helix domain-containing protein [Streptomyces sp. S1D4-11]